MFKNFKSFPCFRVFLDLKESTDTKSGVHHNACRLPCLIAPLYLTLSLPCHLQTRLYLSNKALIFHDFGELKIQFHDFPGLENEMLKFHDFPFFMTCTNPDQHVGREVMCKGSILLLTGAQRLSHSQIKIIRNYNRSQWKARNFFFAPVPPPSSKVKWLAPNFTCVRT